MWQRMLQGGSSGSTVELLWTNENKATSFSPQTINFDLSLYDGVFIEIARHTTVTNGNGISYLPINSEERMITSGNEGSGYTSVRYATVTPNGVTFGKGGYCLNNESNIIYGNDSGLPTRIWGVKGLDIS